VNINVAVQQIIFLLQNNSMTSVRMDKWLWAARFFKTRSLAGRACDLGRIESNGQPAKPAREVRIGDKLRITNEGGDFSATVTASQSVSVVGPYTWSSPQMVADVQDWLDNPAGNFGWLVLGDEKPTLTSKRFDTRESANPPVLTIEYMAGPRVLPTPRPRPTPAPRP